MSDLRASKCNTICLLNLQNLYIINKLCVRIDNIMFKFVLDEARKNFKTFVNILATSKTEGKEKYLLLRKRYYNECPVEDNISNASFSSNAPMSPMSPGSRSAIIESNDSPLRIPPPYRAPPDVSPNMVGLPGVQSTNQYRDCVDEFKNALSNLRGNNSELKDNNVEMVDESIESEVIPPEHEIPKEMPIIEQVQSREVLKSSSNSNIIDVSNANIIVSDDKQIETKIEDGGENPENKLSVKEAMRKFNRIASEEEAKITSPPGKMKKPEKVSTFNFSICSVIIKMILY